MGNPCRLNCCDRPYSRRTEVRREARQKGRGPVGLEVIVSSLDDSAGQRACVARRRGPVWRIPISEEATSMKRLLCLVLVLALVPVAWAFQDAKDKPKPDTPEKPAEQFQALM